ncbi:MAG: hypothetical protein AB7E51_01070 [Pseudodesulfovibrio sp.]|uniref:hypothetical protein n=1 Tax=Pseudodesulfovibrio sp. TaxID=2035812 RepID=UPI003D0AE03C
MDWKDVINEIRRVLMKHHHEITTAPCLSDFPNGSCEAANIIAYEILCQKGFEPELVKGYWDDGNEYHCWLRCCGELADITFEQMDEGSELFFKSEALPQYAKYEIDKTSANEYHKIKDCFKRRPYDLKATVDFVLSKMGN